MKIVLLKDLKGKGKKGDVINVSDGYAYNYLIPNGYAVAGNASNLNQAKQAADAKRHHANQLKQDAMEQAQKLNGMELSIAIKCGENGKIFGSVTNKEVAKELETLGFNVDRKKIELDNIKTLGSHVAKIKLHPEASAKITVNVVAEE